MHWGRFRFKGCVLSFLLFFHLILYIHREEGIKACTSVLNFNNYMFACVLCWWLCGSQCYRWCSLWFMKAIWFHLVLFTALFGATHQQTIFLVSLSVNVMANSSSHEGMQMVLNAFWQRSVVFCDCVSCILFLAVSLLLYSKELSANTQQKVLLLKDLCAFNICTHFKPDLKPYI